MDRTQFERALQDAVQGWIGVAFLHNGRTRSQGVDCLGLIVCLLREAGLPMLDGDGQTYAPDWYLHTPEDRYLDGVLARGAPVRREALLPGDVLYFRAGLLTRGQSPAVTHGGVFLGDDQFIHALNGRNVSLGDLRHKAWTTTYAGAVRPHALLQLLGEEAPA